MDIRISGYPDIHRIEKVIRRILVCHLVQYLKLVLILIQTSQLLPGQVLICMLQQVRLPLAGLFHLRVLPKALVNELLLGHHGAHCERRRRRASRQFSGGPQSGNSLLARQRGEPAPKRPPSPPPSMPPTTTNSAGYPYGYPDIRISAGSSSRSAGYANPAAGSQQLAILTSDSEVGYYHGLVSNSCMWPIPCFVQGVPRLSVYPLAALPLAGAVKTRAS